ncbi:hypothetical protein DFH08DRAFT_904299 [Mycena albidolilacea]|uniref:Uncharacterized protein n=1 Tax=Mycena albidolilacea TaxID=1033008 RepID=A0AAD7E9C9_9AGAR|nr:hypothetical protein DFH08DRAFT_904299 [Mycena albidolilacea]
MLTLRRMPFRPQSLPFRHSQCITHSLSTVLQTSTSAQPVDKRKTRRKRERFTELYRTKLDLHPFSCDWEKWHHQLFLDVHPMWYDLTAMEFFVKRVAKVTGTIRPLAYLPGVDPCVAFEAAGKYYYLNTASDYLERFGGEFDSHDDFLTAFTRYPPIKGAVHQFPDDTEELYAAVWKEQDRRAARAAKTLSSA